MSRRRSISYARSADDTAVGDKADSFWPSRNVEYRDNAAAEEERHLGDDRVALPALNLAAQGGDIRLERGRWTLFTQTHGCAVVVVSIENIYLPFVTVSD